MSIAIRRQPEDLQERPAPLREGERLDQPEFHYRYEQTPEEFHAELIGGIVYIMASPVGRVHSRGHVEVVGWLREFKKATPCVEVMDNATLILGPHQEPQPDSGLRLLPEAGGKTEVNEAEYIVGPPELLVEVSVSTVEKDLTAKKADYERCGVGEYVVILPGENRVAWFARVDERFQEIQPDQDGIFRSLQFPGLWLDPAALLRGDSAAVDAVTQQGTRSPEHRAWLESHTPQEP